MMSVELYNPRFFSSEIQAPARLTPPLDVRLGDICNFGQRPGNRWVTGRD